MDMSPWTCERMSEAAARNVENEISSGTGWTIGIDHAAVTTRNLQTAISFYSEVLGLTLRYIENDPIREGRQRAMLYDASGRDVVELIEMPELAHPAIPGRGAVHHLGFRMTRRDWHSLRSKLDSTAYPYDQVGERLFVRDADGLILEIEHSGH